MLVLRASDAEKLDSFATVVANMVAQEFILHVCPHEHETEKRGSYHLVNVRPDEVLVSKPEFRRNRFDMGHYGVKKIEIVRRSEESPTNDRI